MSIHSLPGLTSIRSVLVENSRGLYHFEMGSGSVNSAKIASRGALQILEFAIYSGSCA